MIRASFANLLSAVFLRRRIFYKGEYLEDYDMIKRRIFGIMKEGL